VFSVQSLLELSGRKAYAGHCGIDSGVECLEMSTIYSCDSCYEAAV